MTVKSRLVSHMAELCELSYDDSFSGVARIDTGICHVLITNLVVGNTVVEVRTFRGTKNLADWVRDFTLAEHEHKSHPGIGAVHAGFLDDVLSVRDDLLSRPVKPVIYNGHSKGGGEAQDAAVLDELDGLPVVACYTFGAPRVVLDVPGNDAMENVYRTIRGQDIRDATDPVPEVPLAFRHPGKPVYQIGKWWWPILPVHHHFISRYRRDLALEGLDD